MTVIQSPQAGYVPAWNSRVTDASAANSADEAIESGDATRKRRERSDWLRTEDFAPDPSTGADWREADGAFARLLGHLFAAGSGLAANALRSSNPQGEANLSALENVDPSTLAMMASMLAMDALGDTAKSTQRALELLGVRQEKLRQEDIKKYREQMDAKTEDANKARKGGIFGVVFDWLIAAVDVVVGAVKVVTGVLTMNPLMIAGGVADVGAGIAGLGAAFHKTMALVDPKNADYHEKEAAKWGHAQLAFQMLGMVIGFGTSIGGFLAKRATTKAASRVFKAGASEALEQAVKSGDKAAIGAIKTRVVSEVGFVVGNEVGKRVGRSLLQNGTQGARRLAKAGFNRMAEQFTQQMVEQMASRAFDKVVKNAAKQVARGKAVSAKTLTQSFTSSMNLQGYFALARGSWSLSSAVRGVFSGANNLGQGIVGVQRAKLQLEARDLAVDMMWLQMLMQINGDDKKRTAKSMETLVGQQNDIAVSTGEQVQKTGEMRIRIAASLARA
ncbi:pathogenicity island 2 effector protein SseC [Pandoraea horticolens]|uniref:Pathogenicity island 2 effector protein SseC n=1 Tax=Pandoraea horticolens TaxID=2508298 RepID=A0A5E4V4Z2_9BURK|nr:type III secretion system translocon subunit SctE [Pandoraea horticolens]VVE06075.1 pathogenicity island 2 effector protein SseC [Pandoraea horticolens]